MELGLGRLSTVSACDVRIRSTVSGRLNHLLWLPAWVTRSLGLDLMPALLTMPLMPRELCHHTDGSGASDVQFISCREGLRPLRILILHNHCPLFTR